MLNSGILEVKYEDNKSTQMPKLNAIIEDFVKGDSLNIVRTITNLPAETIPETAWFTVKKNKTDLDDDAIIQKTVTIDASDDGQITIPEDEDDPLQLEFILLSTDTYLLEANRGYHYDIQIGTEDNEEIFTPEMGKIIALAGVTIDPIVIEDEEEDDEEE